MKVNGIVAEYNPFHNGHSYQLQHAKQLTGADYTIIVMSGNYVQRGAPAMVDKYSRTKMALQNGADLVLELPVCFATSSAESFAMGSVSLLDKLGVVDHLCYGSECGNTVILRKIASILVEEPESYRHLLKEFLHQGLSYPLARTNALLEYDPSLCSYRDVFSSPNNILGIEYDKALLRRKSTIQPVTTLRAGSDYHDRRLGIHQSSAKAIRQSLKAGISMDGIREQMPENAYEVLREYEQTRRFLFSNDFSEILHYKLLLEQAEGYTGFLDVSPDLSDRITKHLYAFETFDSFCDLLKTKDMTYTRISRCLLHILLDLKADTIQAAASKDYITYARVLGFRKESTPLLHAIKEHASIPLVTKLADAANILSSEDYVALQKELMQNDIYQSTSALLCHHSMVSELQKPIVIV